jgi:hypothetical protein
LLEHESDFNSALVVCHNLRDTLDAIGIKERYSGVKKGILKASTGESTKVEPTSKLLHVITCLNKVIL